MSYRTNKWPKKKGSGEEEASTFTLGMVFTPDVVKAADLDPIEVRRDTVVPKPPGRFDQPPMP